MRHRKAGRRLGRTTAPRMAMLGNMSVSLFAEECITTTLPRAKELRSFAERLLTHARKDNLHARRLVARVVHDKEVLRKVFSTLGPRYADRPGGYTRIYKLGYRKGDSAEMAIIELVDRPERTAPRPTSSTAGKKRLVERDEPADKGPEAPSR